jgi:carbonic anhydrase
MTIQTPAIQRLRDGNRRFASGLRARDSFLSRTRREQLAAGQEPFAVVLGCADSRVPPEMIFDQGVGDLFVIRVAGNVVSPPLLGSVEYAVSQLSTPLIVVLGHTGCGAVAATLNEIQRPTGRLSAPLASIVDRIRPAVDPLLAAGSSQTPQQAARQAVRANVHASARQLTQDSALLRGAAAAGSLQIVGAEYSLETGLVEFLHATTAVPED